MSFYHKAAKVYQKKNDENLSPLQIVVELYKGMIMNTREAKKHWQAQNLEAMTHNLTKVFNILEALQSHVELEKGGEDAKFLHRFYTVIFSALSSATAKPEPVEEFDAILSYMQQVHDRWYVMAYGLTGEQTQPQESAQG